MHSTHKIIIKKRMIHCSIYISIVPLHVKQFIEKKPSSNRKAYIKIEIHIYASR